jgi:hypothetical protein
MEKRQHPRAAVSGLIAQITFLSEHGQIVLQREGTVMDLSLMGIKIQLDQALPKDLNDCLLRLTLSQTSMLTPIRISGRLKRLASQLELALVVEEDSNKPNYDDLIFQCTKFSSSKRQ